jgi:hypothetical protein
MEVPMKLAALVLAFAAACSKGAPSDCERAVHHVLFELTTPRGGKGPAGEEAEIVRRIEAMTVPACEREGLSAAQRDCILAARSAEDFPAMLKCPAIAERRPSWILGGP